MERADNAKGYMPSFGGVEAPGSLGVTQAPGMILPECVQSVSNMAWMSARESAGHASTQTGVAVSVTDGRGASLPNVIVILETAPAPQDSACEVWCEQECARSVLGKPPKGGPLHEALMVSEEPASKHSAPDKLPERGWLKGERTKGLSEFGKKNSHGSPCRRPDVLRDMSSARGTPGTNGSSCRTAVRRLNMVGVRVGVAKLTGCPVCE